MSAVDLAMSAITNEAYNLIMGAEAEFSLAVRDRLRPLGPISLGLGEDEFNVRQPMLELGCKIAMSESLDDFQKVPALFAVLECRDRLLALLSLNSRELKGG